MEKISKNKKYIKAVNKLPKLLTTIIAVGEGSLKKKLISVVDIKDKTVNSGAILIIIILLLKLSAAAVFLFSCSNRHLIYLVVLNFINLNIQRSRAMRI